MRNWIKHLIIIDKVDSQLQKKTYLLVVKRSPSWRGEYWQRWWYTSDEITLLEEYYADLV